MKLAMALAFLFLAASTLPTPAQAADANTIRPLGIFFLPPILIVSAGSTVTWDNSIEVAGHHTMTTANGIFEASANQANDPNDTDCIVNGQPGEDQNPDTCNVDLLPGVILQHAFQTPGTYVYYCKQHLLQKMTGVIIVV
jgi:plastocyanin